MFWADILLFAAIAGFFGYRLWRQLGQKHGEERERPNPFAEPAERREDLQQNPGGQNPGRAAPIHAGALVGEPIVENGDGGPLSLASELERVQSADPNFDEKTFLHGARAAFAMIVEAFAKGDRASLRDLLSPKVLANFEQAIATREKAGESLETRILQLRDAVVVAARLEGSIAQISVEFSSDQINLTRDAQGRVINGDAQKPEIVIDRWTFSRDARSEDPNWLLSATEAVTG